MQKFVGDQSEDCLLLEVVTVDQASNCVSIQNLEWCPRSRHP